MNAALHGAGAPLRKSWPRTRFDNEPLPIGQCVGELPTAQLTALLVDTLHIPGCAHTLGREANVEHYAAHLAGIRERGALAAVADWLMAHASNAPAGR